MCAPLVSTLVSENPGMISTLRAGAAAAATALPDPAPASPCGRRSTSGTIAAASKTGAGTLVAEADRIGVMRRAIGDEPFDMNAAHDLPDCIDFARAVEPYRIVWLEEPLHWY